ncbi:MAG: hypothetical protein JSV21_01570 [Nitrospirota bacterium]|nr:MAG: hypothetical protein JSV21_01570 [Nitrospirota bacterium]
MIEIDSVHSTRRKPRKCPNCGSKRIARILYGPADFYPELTEEVESGRAVVKPCCTRGPVASWECSFCGAGIFKESGISEPSLF